MVKKTTTKQPRTIKVRTVVISVAVFIALIASFFGGIAVANGYNDTVDAKAHQKAEAIKELSSKSQK